MVKKLENKGIVEGKEKVEMEIERKLKEERKKEIVIMKVGGGGI